MRPRKELLIVRILLTVAVMAGAWFVALLVVDYL